ncbi:hypothetical protein ACFLSY_01985 [Bacteroidota bacterium]
METKQILNRKSTCQVGAIAGLFAIICYLGASVLSMPDLVTRFMVFAFGPLLVVGFIGIYSFFQGIKHGPELQISFIFGILAGATLTLMIIIQIANGMWHQEAMDVAKSDDAILMYKAALIGADRVQLGMDITMDIFITISIILLGICLLRNSLTSKIFGISGILLASLLLILNMITFPNPPGSAGLYDAGPIFGLWLLAFFVWLTILSFQKKRST